jgi:hypothetical protein
MRHRASGALQNRRGCRKAGLHLCCIAPKAVYGCAVASERVPPVLVAEPTPRRGVRGTAREWHVVGGLKFMACSPDALRDPSGPHGEDGHIGAEVDHYYVSAEAPVRLRLPKTPHRD